MHGSDDDDDLPGRSGRHTGLIAIIRHPVLFLPWPGRRRIRSPPWNDGPAKQAIIDFVEATTDQASPLCAARGSHRHLRSGRHAVGVASALRAGDVRARPGARTGAETSGVEKEGAVQGGSRRRSCGDGQIQRGGLGADHRRHPRRDEHRGSSSRSSNSGWRRRSIPASSGRTPTSSTSRCWKLWITCGPTASGPTSSPAVARSSCASTATGSTACLRSRWWDRASPPSTKSRTASPC